MIATLTRRTPAPAIDATSALIAGLKKAVPAALSFVDVRSRAWATATFSGARHEMTFRTEESAASAFAASIGSISPHLRGHLLADIILVSDECSDGERLLRVEALTVEENQRRH